MTIETTSSANSSPTRASDVVVDVTGLSKTFLDRSPKQSELAWRDGITRLLFGRNSKKGKRVPALIDVDLKVHAGEILGVLGLNGAGKTTLLKVLTAQLLPDAGTGTIFGYDVVRERKGVRSVVSLVKFGGWQNTLFQLTVRGNLDFYAKLNGLPADLARPRIDEALALLGLTSKANEYPWYLSAGQLQKLNLAQIFLVRTPLVVLDEPTAHLDPVAARQVRGFITDILNERLGQTVILTTHYVHEAEDLCDRVAFLHAGRIVRLGPPRELVAALGDPRRLHLVCEHPTAQQVRELVARGWRPAPDIGAGRRELIRELATTEPASRALLSLEPLNLRLTSAWTEKSSLADIYAQIEQSDNANAA